MGFSKIKTPWNCSRQLCFPYNSYIGLVNFKVLFIESYHNLQDDLPYKLVTCNVSNRIGSFIQTVIFLFPVLVSYFNVSYFSCMIFSSRLN